MRAAALLVTSFAAGFVLASAACATLPACPAKGGPAWTRWTSPHFDLLTDLDASDAQLALRDFEELRAAVLFAAWRRAPEPSGRITVFVLRGASERRVFLQGKYLASAVMDARLHTSFILKDGVDRDNTVTHGIVAMLERHFGLYGRAPWFDAGLAYYLDALSLFPDGSLTYGQLEPRLYRAIERGSRLSFERLWQPFSPDLEWRWNATSWLAVHYLFNHEPARMRELQRRLAVGQDGDAAWREVFPDLPPAVMDERLAEYVFNGGQFLTFKAQLPPVTYTATSRPLDDAAVHAARALLFATSDTTPAANKPAVVAAEVDEALRLEPLQPLALYVRRAFLREDVADVEQPKSLIARAPDDPLGWLLLARAREARHEKAEAAEAWDEVRARAPSDEAPVDLDECVARPAD